MGESNHRDGNDLDAVDRRIIALLEEDGRRTNADISRVVGVSQSTVRARIDRLMQRGVIRVVALVDPRAAGYGQDTFVGINVRSGANFPVGEALAEMHEVVFLAYVAGRYDILIEVLSTDSEALLDFLGRRLSEVDGIRSLETLVTLRNEKVTYYNWGLHKDSTTEASSEADATTGGGLSVQTR